MCWFRGLGAGPEVKRAGSDVADALVSGAWMRWFGVPGVKRAGSDAADALVWRAWR